MAGAGRAGTKTQVMVKTSPKQRRGSPCLHQALLSCETVCHRLLWQPNVPKVGKAVSTDALRQPDTPAASSWDEPRSHPPSALLPCQPGPCCCLTSRGLALLLQEQECFGTWWTASWQSSACERGEGTKIPEHEAELSTQRYLLPGRNHPLPATAASAA